MTHAIFRQVLGTSFDLLDAPVRAFHELSGEHELQGWVQIDAPASMAARFLARCLGTPVATVCGALRFQLDASADREWWTRHFPARTMRSCLTHSRGEVVERLGPVALCFTLQVREGRLVMQLERLRLLGLACPRWLMPSVHAEERGLDGRIHFDVRASMPVIGQVAAYRGHLELPAGLALQDAA
jgi:hypothetical protein